MSSQNFNKDYISLTDRLTGVGADVGYVSKQEPLKCLQDINIRIRVNVLCRIWIEVNASDPHIEAVPNEVEVLHQTDNPKDLALIENRQTGCLEGVIDHHLQSLHANLAEVAVDVILVTPDLR